MPKKCLSCGWSDAPEHARFCAMCGDEALVPLEDAREVTSEASGDEESRGQEGNTEVMSSEEVQMRLTRMQSGIDESARGSDASARDARSSRSFSETMWFIRGLDFDQLVDDSEEVRQDDLQERYEGQEEVRAGIRKQFSLSSEFDEEYAADEETEED